VSVRGPERGGVGGGVRGPGRLRTWMSAALVGLIAAAGMALVLTQHWRRGAVLLGVSLLVAAVLRGVVPPERAGLLVIRSRAVDVGCYVVLGAVMIILAVQITRGSLTVQ
jgi:Protein of unknown function (DUF3017)